MTESIFADYINKYFNGLSKKYTESWNGKTIQPTYLIHTMTSEEYSVDGNWDSTEIKNSIVAADIVSLNSSLPLKKRASFGFAKGKIPKIGIAKKKHEDDIERINLMKAKGQTEQVIAEAIFGDLKACPESILTRVEMMFEEGLSTGMYQTEGENNGTAVRVDFGYKADNKLKATKVWGTTGYTPITDLNKMIERASTNGTKAGAMIMSKTAFNNIRKSAEGKALYCNYAGLKVETTIVPTKSKMLEALQDEYECEIIIVDNSFKVEKPDGTEVTYKSWKDSNVIIVPDKKCGRVVYSQLAEETNKVEGVKYNKIGAYTLVSMYRETNPLEEVTAGQAKAIPVIDSASYIILLDTQTAE